MTTYETCTRNYFGNGDVGFYYTDESLVFKIQGEIWIMDTLKADYFTVLNSNYGIGKLYNSGELLIPNIFSGQSMSIKGELKTLIRDDGETINKITDNLWNKD